MWHVAVLAACVLAAVSASAQGHPSACDPVAPPAQVVQASHTLYGEIRIERQSAELVHAYAALLLRALAYKLTLPSPLKLAVWGNVRYQTFDSLQGGGGAWIHPDLPLGAYLVINKTGTLRRLVLAQSTLVGTIDSSLVAQLASVVDTAVLSPVLLQDARDSVVLYFTTSIRADSSRGRGGLDSGTIIQPLARVLLPHVRLTSEPRLVRGSFRLDYPRRSGMAVPADGSVHVQFTVGTDGRVAPSSLRLRYGSSPEFVEAVYDAIAQMEFEPAVSGGCAVAKVIDQTFRFDFQYIVR
jgi:TonB family protein